jgi:hypothetical protein
MFDTKPLTKEQAKTVYKILQEECGATPEKEFSFVMEFISESPCTEFRFGGSLGPGGKFRYPKMRVDCYPEDATAQRLKSVERTNLRLAEFQAEVGNVGFIPEKK